MQSFKTCLQNRGYRNKFSEKFLSSPYYLRSARLTLDRESLDQLNEYFGNLCSDTNYIRPVDIHSDPDVKANNPSLEHSV